MVIDVTTPTRTPATIAPAYEPRPPIVTITKAGMIAAAAIDGFTVHSGPASIPARPASRQPIPKTLLNTIGRLMPRRPTISASREPARMIRPNRVYSRKLQKVTSAKTVTAKTVMRYFVIRIGPYSTKPDRNLGGLNG